MLRDRADHRRRVVLRDRAGVHRHREVDRLVDRRPQGERTVVRPRRVAGEVGADRLAGTHGGELLGLATHGQGARTGRHVVRVGARRGERTVLLTRRGTGRAVTGSSRVLVGRGRRVARALLTERDDQLGAERVLDGALGLGAEVELRHDLRGPSLGFRLGLGLDDLVEGQLALGGEVVLELDVAPALLDTTTATDVESLADHALNVVAELGGRVQVDVLTGNELGVVRLLVQAVALVERARPGADLAATTRHLLGDDGAVGLLDGVDERVEQHRAAGDVVEHAVGLTLGVLSRVGEAATDLDAVAAHGQLALAVRQPLDHLGGGNRLVEPLQGRALLDEGGGLDLGQRLVRLRLVGHERTLVAVLLEPVERPLVGGVAHGAQDDPALLVGEERGDGGLVQRGGTRRVDVEVEHRRRGGSVGVRGGCHERRQPQHHRGRNEDVADERLHVDPSFPELSQRESPTYTHSGSRVRYPKAGRCAWVAYSRIINCSS